MKKKTEIIGCFACIALIVGLITIIYGAAIGNEVLIHISLLALLFIFLYLGFILRFLIIIYESQEEVKVNND